MPGMNRLAKNSEPAPHRFWPLRPLLTTKCTVALSWVRRKHFNFAYFATLDDEGKKALLACCRSGIENPDSGMGCYAMQPSDYDRFKPFFSKVVLLWVPVCVTIMFVSAMWIAAVLLS